MKRFNNDVERMQWIWEYRVHQDQYDDVCDFADDIQSLIYDLEDMLDDDEADREAIKADIDSLNDLKDEVNNQLAALDDEEAQYMEHEYWSMVM